ELVAKIVAKARKYGVTFLLSRHQSRRKSPCLGRWRKSLSNRACFAIADHQGNDAILGTGKPPPGSPPPPCNP
ncbi:hypothetical protein, partial [Pseudonocardia sp. ICBG601]|uniref:hypothetical protein n=1 Tax=Pseudonocardia sp. ICBG601 TaxID=2846759 RepID=UPI001CF63128